MGKNIQNAIKISISIGLAVLLLVLVFRKLDFNALWSEFQKVNYWWIVVSMCLSLASHWVRGLRWNVLYQPLGYTPPSLHAFYAIMVGYMTNWAVPRMGEVARCSVLHKTDSIPVAISVGTVVTERILDVLALGMLTLLALLFEWQKLIGLFNAYVSLPTIHVTWTNILVGMAGVSALIGISVLIYRFLTLSKMALVMRVRSFMLQIWQGVLSITKVRNFWQLAGYTWLMWLMYVGTLYLCFFSMQATQSLNFMTAFVVTVVSAISMIAPVQGGVGVYHVLVAATMVSYGIAPEQGLVFATVANASQFVSMIASGALSTLAVALIHKKDIEIQ